MIDDDSFFVFCVVVIDVVYVCVLSVMKCVYVLFDDVVVDVRCSVCVMLCCILMLF